MLCQYKDIFGQPNKGFHKWRIPYLNMALFDVLGTILIIWLITRWSKVDWIVVSMMILTLTVFLHLLFCVPTHLEQYAWIILILLALLYRYKTVRQQ